MHRYAKQGAGFGNTEVRGLNPLLATVSTLFAVPVIAAARLRRGPANSAQGAVKLLGEAIAPPAAAGSPAPARRGW